MPAAKRNTTGLLRESRFYIPRYTTADAPAHKVFVFPAGGHILEGQGGFMRHPFRSHLYQGPRLKGRRRDSGRREYFEGWYFKQAFPDGRVIACIPGVSFGSDPHGFIQINDSARGSDYIRFAPEEVEIAPDSLDVRISGNRFSLSGIDLDISGELGSYRGSIRFDSPQMLRPRPYRPGIMGPFSYIPAMECYHGLVSMNHGLSGSLDCDGEILSAEGGRGYIEKDWGRSFPHAWVWMQANSFSDEASMMLSFARIPWGRASFPGHLGFLYHREIMPEPMVFATYSRHRLVEMNLSGSPDAPVVHAVVAGGRYRLEIQALSDGGRDLVAPVRGKMDRIIKETVNGRISCRLFEAGGALLWEQESIGAGIEVQGPVDSLIGELSS
jgi:tocopherol cyclase